MKWFGVRSAIISKKSALIGGTAAPMFTLPKLGGGEFSLPQALTGGSVLLAFFKASCPVCQMAFPFYQRLHQIYANHGVTVVGVSQNSAADASAFAKKFGLTFPIALDDIKSYPVSNAYGLTNVPTVFLVYPAGQIDVSSVSWAMDEVEDIARRMAEASAVPPMPLFLSTDQVPVFRPG